LGLVGGMISVEAANPRLNPMVELLAKKKPVFGLYVPSAGRGRGAAPPAGTPAPPVKTAADLAKEALAAPSDFIFDGSMEGGVDRGLPAFTTMLGALSENGLLVKTPSPHLSHSIVVKMQEIGTDYAKATEAIGKQLDAGVTTIMLVDVREAAEVEAGIKAMRYKNKGGTRPDSTGAAPKIWGLSESDYKKKADLWPLNKDGELVAWAIVESKEGLAKTREIAAVKGLGVLWPGAGTLRGVFSNPKIGADGKQEIGPNGRGVMVQDTVAWEAAIQQVLAACKEFKVPCGYPANTPEEMELRYKQGFSVFVGGWGENGTKMVQRGRDLRK
jgi:2-keto-3-deoxy-L-rhamnonate aldolase RhmA